MLKATVHYGPQELGLQQKVPEARAVDGNVGPLDIFLRGCWGTLCRSLGLFIFLVIQKLIFDILFRHDAGSLFASACNEESRPTPVTGPAPGHEL